MAIEQANVLDAIGINEENGNIELLINDGRDWSDEGEHLELLQQKLNLYLQFIVEEQIYEVFSSPEDYERKRYIVINFTQELSTNAIEFLEYFKLALTQNNIFLGWLVEQKA